MTPIPRPPENRPLVPPDHALPGPEEVRLQADYFDGHIDLRAFAARYPHYRVLSSSPMVLEPEQGRYFFLSRFGAVVAWNCPEALIHTLHEDLGKLPNTGRRVESARDSLTVFLGSGRDKVGYNEVWLGDLTLDKLKVISLALAQSVALDHFEATAHVTMGKFQPVVTELREEGRLKLKQENVLKIAGFAMDVRSAVLYNLALFDPPPETWESEALGDLHKALKHQFDLEDRLEALKHKLGYLADAGAQVLDVLNTRTSHRLEWIIIVLIFIETGFFIWKEILFR